MQKHNHDYRQSRTRTLVQLGGLLQKSKIAEACSIETGDDLQSAEFFPKAVRLLGFLSCCRDNSFHEEHIQRWEALGRKLLRPPQTPLKK